ncbi:DUF1573 domain-containing protein [Aeoliella sp. ICT_H6.2]|uniref:DUF1573 domain-containing protein n=1 Tax=Aeoliella straminimaris TaxID=2954799 RepID=A0A9X2FD39_9BACT|nr:DUF1573 domain-containing protein [Aeoliella straminimaris]MCO6046740.1 DUF1573 domain-containing protein [Aeoliella straminimaris]
MRALPIVVVSLLIGSSVGAWSAYQSVGSQRSAEEISALRGDTTGDESDYPKFEIDAVQYDFGSMQRGTSRKHSFKVTNKGTKPLTVQVVSTTCKCTAGDMAKNPIPPGETEDLTLTWVAKVNAGTFRQTATLETNDPRARRVELTVEGMVNNVSTVEPNQWFFDKLRAEDQRTESLYVMSFEDEDLEIESANIENPEDEGKYNIEVVEVPHDELPDAKAKAGYRVDVTPLGKLPLGPIHDWVMLHTNIKEAEELRVPIMGTVVGDIELRGPAAYNDVTGSVHFGDVQSEEGAEVKLFLNVGGEHAADTKFEVAELDPEYLEVELGEPRKLRDDLYHVPLTLRLPPGLPPAIRNGTGQGEGGSVVLKTNHPTSPEISFGVRFVIKGAAVTK